MPSHRRPEADREDDAATAPHRAPRARRRRPARRPPVRRWSDLDDEEDDAEATGTDAAPPSGRPAKEPVYFRARDSAYFEFLVAIAIIVVLLVGMFAYTQNWPPMYVVESNSMQHGLGDQVGLINTGDLVLAQKVSAGDVVPYEVGQVTGYRTYGEYGDVILYHPDGRATVAPIIHRAILFIEIAANGTASFPSLAGQPCGTEANAVYAIAPSASGCGTSYVTGTLTLYHVGWRSVSVTVDLQTIGSSSGFLTMGDNNFDPTDLGQGNPDQPYLSTLVEPGWIVGVARGMVPWFGSFKLLLDGNAGEVPSQSWEWMGLTLVGLVLAAIGVHYVFRAEGIEDERRKADEAAEEEAADDDGPRRRGRGPPARWRHPDDEDEEEDEEPAVPSKPRFAWFRGGRPRPSVGRAPPPRRNRRPPARRQPDGDDDL